MNILVTGGLGVNGSWVSRQLLQMGHRPVVYDCRPDFSLVADIAGQLDVVIGDILDFASIIRTIREKRIERICHLAWLMPEQAEQNPAYAFQVCAVGTVNILEAARTLGLDRVVFTSSKGALSPITGEFGYPSYRPVAEDYPTYPTYSIYSAAKVASELMGHNYHRKYGLDFIALRYSFIYGPGKKARHGVIAIPNKIVENAMLGKPTVISHGGDEQDDMVYVRDVANSVVVACFAPKPQHLVFHVGTGKGSTLRGFSAAVRKVYPQAVIEIGPGRDPRNFGDSPMYCIFDIRLAREELGFEPQYDLETGVKDWIEWQQRLGLEPTYSP